MDAVPWAAGPEGQAAGLRVINLSLAGYADPAAPGARGKPLELAIQQCFSKVAALTTSAARKAASWLGVALQ
jgi:hypothetical protein